MARFPFPVLGEISPALFLERYWQKEPLLVRKAFPDLKDPLTADELAGLACEPDVDSRLVMERGGRKPWQVTRGPQRVDRLRKLPASHWTLLIESVDRHSDAIAAFASAFTFLPRWRMDDVMVSLSPVQGTVEAHIDSYDVFLIQGQGRRRWEVDLRSVEEYRPGLDLRILRRFRPQGAWTLEPGDFLYVPPGVGHRGVTVPSDAEIAITYSVGFRAPSSADLISALLTRTLARETPHLFADSGRGIARDPAALSEDDLASLQRFLMETIAASPDDWALAAGEAVTAGGSGHRRAVRISAQSLARRLGAGASIAPMPGARVSWCGLARGKAALFVNGESRVLPREQAFAASLLCGRSSPSSARKLAANPTLLALCVDLLRAGVLTVSN